jgi:DNA-binding CsgD family transcriptional regulator
MQPFLDPPVRRQRSVAARRTAGLNRAEREARIVSLLNRGVAIAEIAAREGLSLKRMRNLVREILAQRMPQPPADLTLEEIESLWKWFESDALSLEAADILGRSDDLRNGDSQRRANQIQR